MTSVKQNQLIHEKSPYLLQHAHNPVDWFPWGDEAFEKARTEGKPVLVSIGYSTCHWCHVMAHESFEDDEVARLLNEHFVAIKVDREERPDVDAIYMKVCQAMTGQGGWPLNVFVTPEQKPFYAGTYFPKESRYGRPGFIEVLTQLSKQFTESREKLEEIGEQVRHAFSNAQREKQKLESSILHQGYRELAQSFDPEWGGFGHAPKFPAPHQITYLLRYHRWTGEEKAFDMLVKSLEAMADGGIYDHIGGGFARYSVDEYWLVPHFEKMLYDQAMLLIAFTEAYQVTQNERFRRVAEEIVAYVQREMKDDLGGYYSAEDADSEGVEGKFYVWDKAEVLDILGVEAGEAFCEAYDITDAGNFEGKNIPNLIGRGEPDHDFEKEKQQLFTAREARVHPHKDDKILTSWNGLLAAALAQAGRVFGREEYVAAARGIVRFIDEYMTVDGRLMARYRDGEVKFKGYIDDYAFVLWAAIELYESTFDAAYLQKAKACAQEMKALFWDEAEGGFFFYGEDAEQLMMRPKELYDAAVPSGNSVAAVQLYRLSKLTGETEWEALVAEMNEVFATEVQHAPSGYSYYLQSLLTAHMAQKEVVVLGEQGEPSYEQMIGTLQREFLPEVVYLAAREADALGGVASYAKDFPETNETTVYVCENFACSRPTTDVDQVIKKFVTSKTK
ncbi:MAG TPA: thioredoxin domain-containing protein [Bacillales bacterium]|nr:thioredoxin domain-containing protein [Bacillales bacterium]